MLLSFTLCLLLACGDKDGDDTAPADDGGATDGGSTDGGGADGGGTDGGSADGGGADGGGSDGGSTDGGSTDGGGSSDGGSEALGPAVILMVGDGMGFEHVRGGGLYANGAVGSLAMETLPVQGRLQTASLSGLTDSAASATAMATGHKTWNGVLGLDRDLEALQDLAQDARDSSMSVGVVTSDSLLGATPSAFTADVENRGDGDGITAALVAQPPDIMLGGGAGDLAGPLADAGVQVAETLDAADLATLPLAVLVAEGKLPYVAEEADGVPPLADLATTALAALEPDPDGFFLMVEGARIDHASHANLGQDVHAETAAFDAAVAAVMAWADDQERPVSLVVTADHECGGMQLLETDTEAGVAPDTAWLWGDHTNADVPVFARGPYTDVLDEQRLHNSWVHAVLQAALMQADTVVEPELPRLPDGDLDDLGAPIATQLYESSFGTGYNQLDGLHLTADEDGLWIGLDGAFDSQANGLFVFLDLDYGAGTGLGADLAALEDGRGDLDSVLTALDLRPELDALGFDAALGSLHATYGKAGGLSELAGLRGFVEPWGLVDDLWWLPAAINFDSGNMALHGSPAEDAGDIGLTEGGAELWVPWSSLYPDGLPPEGQSVAVLAFLANDDGSNISDQVLPPLPDEHSPGASMDVASVAVLEIDGDGVAIGAAEVVDSAR